MHVQLDPHHGTPAYHQAISRIHGACQKVFRRQKDKAVEEAKRLLKTKRATMFKDDKPSVDDFDPEKIAGFIIEEVQAEFENLPSEVRPALEQAILSGINNGILQLEIHDTSMIASANNIAAKYASERAAELVGMKYDVEGNLVENPNAEWAISDTTRDKIQRIVTQAFEGETNIKDVAAKIQTALQDDEAGIFTDARAEMIAQTEVANAQAEGNFDVWKQSGLVETVKWTVSADEPCDECEGNEDEEVEFGKEFQSGDIMPPAHPRCRCVLVAVKIKEG
jgi:SPP1 gp7 family putative phage head morphogenesis protein